MNYSVKKKSDSRKNIPRQYSSKLMDDHTEGYDSKRDHNDYHDDNVGSNDEEDWNHRFSAKDDRARHAKKVEGFGINKDTIR